MHKTNTCLADVFKCFQRSFCISFGFADGHFFFTGDYEAVVVMGIMILASVTITFVQEYRSQKASLALKRIN